MQCMFAEDWDVCAMISVSLTSLWVAYCMYQTLHVPDALESEHRLWLCIVVTYRLTFDIYQQCWRMEGVTPATPDHAGISHPLTIEIHYQVCISGIESTEGRQYWWSMLWWHQGPLWVAGEVSLSLLAMNGGSGCQGIWCADACRYVHQGILCARGVILACCEVGMCMTLSGYSVDWKRQGICLGCALRMCMCVNMATCINWRSQSGSESK